MKSKLKAQHPTLDELLRMPQQEQDDAMLSLIDEIRQAIKTKQCTAILVAAINDNGRALSFAASMNEESKKTLVADVEEAIGDLKASQLTNKLH